MADPTKEDLEKARKMVAGWHDSKGLLWELLAQALADEREAMRESAAKACELIGEGYGHEFAERIRRLP